MRLVGANGQKIPRALPKPPIQPRSDLVLLVMDPDEEVSSGGIYLARGKKSRTGTVIAVGPGALSDNIPPPYRMPIGIEVGERVYIQDSNCVHEWEEDGDKFVLTPQMAILGTLA